jgi:ribonuclease G
VNEELERPENGLVIASSPGETRAALIEAGDLVSLAVTRRDRSSRVGDVYRARVTRVDRAIRGAFLDLGAAGDGFLGFENGGETVSEGQRLLVQIRRDPENGKPIGASTRIELAGRLAVFTPGGAEIAVSRRLPPAQRRRLSEEAAALAEPGEGWQVRTAASVAPGQALAAEMAALRATTEGWIEAGEPGLVHAEPGAVAQALRDAIEARLDVIIVDDRAALLQAETWCRRWRPDLAGQVRLHSDAEDVFVAFGLDVEIDEALARRVALPGGGFLIVETTRALTSIDVDRGGAQVPPFDINEQAAYELVKQLRLRDIGGMILVDFLRMRDRTDRDTLLQRLREAAHADPLGLEVLGFTRAGLVELTRPRRRAGLADFLLVDCAACGAAAAHAHPDAAALASIRALLREVRHDPAARLGIAAAPAIAASLAGAYAGALAEAGERFGRAITVASDPDLAPDRYEIVRGAS